MKRRIVLYSILLMIVACRNTETRETATVKPVLEKKVSNEEVEYRSYMVENGDTITPSGKFLRFQMDSLFDVTMTWGKGKFERSWNIGKPFGSYNPPWYYCEWKNHIGVISGCGTECSVLQILPLNANDSIRKYMNPILVDTIQNFVFHIESKGDQIYKLVNLESGKAVQLDLTLNYVGYYGDAIDTVYFLRNGLFMRWEDSNYVKQERKFYFRL